ncbi:hypothetical protein CR513_61677, partial [Mucuna pruriens]
MGVAILIILMQRLDCTYKHDYELSNITISIEECLHTSSYLTYLWHQRYGHLSYKGLKTLQMKKMSEWHDNKVLELVQVHICKLIELMSNSGKRYILHFIDDYSCKGIKQQLTTTYTPHPNRVAEKQNSYEHGSQTFLTKVIIWTFYLLNRYPPLAVKNITPQRSLEQSQASNKTPSSLGLHSPLAHFISKTS